MWTSQHGFQRNDMSIYPKRLPILSVGLLLCLGLVSCQSSPPSPPSTDINTPVLQGDAEAVDEAIAPQEGDVSPSPPNPPSSIPQSVFEGGGFTVTITGSGSEAAYKGCDAKQDCIEIPQVANFARGTYTWENEGYTYVMAPVTSGSEVDSGAYQLRVYDPGRSAIVDTVMRPSGENEPDNIGGDVVLDPNILDEFYTQAETLGACSDYFDIETSQNVSATYPVNGDDAIVEVLCFLAAYQGAYEYWFYQATDSGGIFTPLSFDTYTAPEADGRSRIQVRELGGLPTYEPDQETLTIFTKYRGLSDCGSYSEYQWQGDRFELITYRSKEECDGNAIAPTEYPQIYP